MIRNKPKFVLDTIALILPKEFDTCGYSNGEGYIQLTLITHAKFVLNYRQLVEQEKPELMSMFDAAPAGFIGRHLDYSRRHAYALWNIMACIDNKLRLWGQPYFALNPDKAKQVCLTTV